MNDAVDAIRSRKKMRRQRTPERAIGRATSSEQRMKAEG
jgi:hypothetical protein